jgi:hypothetical protein
VRLIKRPPRRRWDSNQSLAFNRPILLISIKAGCFTILSKGPQSKDGLSALRGREYQCR